MSKTYTDIKNRISNKIRDNNWINNHSAQILNSVNNALDDINIGNIGEENITQVGYDFQREIQDILFTDEVTGTITTGGATTLTDSTATFLTSEDVAIGDFITNSTDSSVARVISVDSETQLTTSTLRNGTLNVWTLADSYTIEGKGYAIASSWNFKFPLELRLAENRNIKFEYVNPEYFKRKKDVNYSSESMFTIEWEGNNQIIELNYDTTEALFLEFISNNMIKDTSGTRKIHITANDDILLMPDIYFETIVDLATADIYGQNKGYNDSEYNVFLNEGRKKLKNMINSIGIKMKSPRRQVMIQSEWTSSRRILRR